MAVKATFPDRDELGSFVLSTSRAASLQVFDYLRAEIIKGRIKPHTQLSEANLCHFFEVSRQPVREALLRLSMEDLVRIFPQRGSVVTGISVPMVQRAQLVREAVEVEMVSRAIDRCDDAFLADLETELRLQAAFVEVGDISRFFQSDQSFHKRICDQSGVNGVWESLEASRSQLDRARHADLQMVDGLDRLISQHKRVYDGIAAGDRDQSIDAMRNHLRRVLRRLQTTIQRAPDLFEDIDG